MDRLLQKRLQEKLVQLKESDKAEPIRADGCGALTSFIFSRSLFQIILLSLNTN